ncbi:hypothetical protein M5K25_010810 [Dendrobium thyrsiflorum]|uniref:Uncharacterized protein n=1 Tax=Dendrobium thyrsiflorum TaxID=117978 RepID=A0ABD0V842_DENTH
MFPHIFQRGEGHQLLVSASYLYLGNVIFRNGQNKALSTLVLCHHQEGKKGEGFSAVIRRVRKDMERFSAITSRVRKDVEQFFVVTGEGEKGRGTFPSLGNRINMTPLLSIVTHLIMTNTPIDEAQLILDYIHNLTDIRHPQTKRKKNIALGHLVSYVLDKKYSMIYPEPPTEEPIFFTNASFRALFHEDQAAGGEDEEREATLEPAPGPNQNAYQEIIN